MHATTVSKMHGADCGVLTTRRRVATTTCAVGSDVVMFAASV
jgi:hypothetical protein